MAKGEMVKKTFRSYGKVNLFLKLLGERSDGFTEIRTLFQTIGLSDTLRFKTVGEDKIELRVDGDYSVPSDESNLVFRAVKLLKERFKISKGVSIQLTKKIPVGAGLGGGSGNCAVTLLALNDLWNLNLNFNELCEIGSSLGSDIPFFLRGGTAFGFGKGDEIIFLPDGYIDLKGKKVLLVVPDFSINTSWAYSLYKNYLLTTGKVINKITCLNGGNFNFFNDFEKVLFEKFPIFFDLKKMLLNFGANVCIISGSGSVLFAIFDGLGRREKELIRVSLPETFKIFVTEFISSKEYLKLIYD